MKQVYFAFTKNPHIVDLLNEIEKKAEKMNFADGFEKSYFFEECMYEYKDVHYLDFNFFNIEYIDGDEIKSVMKAFCDATFTKTENGDLIVHSNTTNRTYTVRIFGVAE